MSKTTIKVRTAPDRAPMRITGRNAWALLALIAAGDKGCTPIEVPGPRWSSYVHKLRTRHGIIIETVHETHGGPFAGEHARYVLRSSVEVVEGAEDRPAA